MAGQVLGGRYTVQDKIGTGGMATVYRGVDNVLSRAVAIKTMLPQYAADDTFAARFKQEAQAAAALQSPYIVSIFDWGKDGDTYYIVMEYLRGTDLKSGIRTHGPLECKKVAQIGSQIASALTVAHRHDIIHRDIKPQNIMVQPDGNIKVMDFGIARAKNSHLTTDNNVLGTAHYVSPEQTQGKELGPTTDIYSLGVVMYEAACGRVPFDGPDAISVALKQVQEQPIPPSQVNPKVDPSLESIILKCMQKDPADRFASAEDLRHTLNDYLAGRYAAVGEATTVIGTVARGVDPSVTATRTLPRAQVAPLPANKHYGPSGRSSARHEVEPEINQRKGPRVGVILGIIAGMLAVAALAFFVMNNVFTGSETKAVPNLLSMTREQAESTIKNSDFFTLGTVTEEYSATAVAGQVIGQSPKNGATATKGTMVNLTVSKGPQPVTEVTVPSLVGMTPTEAMLALSNAGLKASAGETVASDTVDVGRIASQEPVANSKVQEGATVTYHASSGPEAMTMPLVVGESQQTATQTLEKMGLTVVIGGYEPSNNYDDGYVSKQSVSEGTKMTKGDRVVLTVSSGPSSSGSSSGSSSDSGSSSSSGSGSSSSSGSGGSSSGSGGSSGGSSSGSSSGGSSGGSSGSGDSEDEDSGGYTPVDDGTGHSTMAN